jgi:NADPH:quinone reductase-like Zn-dependent oxidoreductase
VLAVRLHPDGLRIEELPTPVPGPGEVLVEVHAAALTRDELTWFPDRLPLTPSYEVSGVAGGQEVFGMTPCDRDGVAAEYAVVPESCLAPKPARLSHVEAAALPLAGLSAWQGLFDHGALQAGERVLVTGPRGGVGHLAVQLARRHGAEVVDELPADLVFDTTGSDLRGARTISVADELPGATYFTVEPDRAQLLELAALPLEIAIDSVFPLAEAEAAFARTAASGKHGKVVLRVRDR